MGHRPRLPAVCCLSVDAFGRLDQYRVNWNILHALFGGGLRVDDLVNHVHAIDYLGEYGVARVTARVQEGIVGDVDKELADSLKSMALEGLGIAEVRDVFRSPKFGAVAGCMVLEVAMFVESIRSSSCGITR